MVHAMATLGRTLFVGGSFDLQPRGVAAGGTAGGAKGGAKGGGEEGGGYPEEQGYFEAPRYLAAFDADALSWRALGQGLDGAVSSVASNQPIYPNPEPHPNPKPSTPSF